MNDDLLQTLQTKLQLLDAVNAIGKTLTGSLDLPQILANIIHRIQELRHPRTCVVFLDDAEKGELVLEVAIGEGVEKIVGSRLKRGEGIAGWAAEKQKSVLVSDRDDPRHSKSFDETYGELQRSVLVSDRDSPRHSKSSGQEGEPVVSIIAVPLISRRRTLGVIEMVNGLDDRPFRADDVQLVEMLAEFAAIGIDNARSYQRIEELTILDEHTSLYNSRFLYRALEGEVERARRFVRPLSLLFVDLDHFKNVNDSYGHAAGTALLAEVGQLITSSLRTVDIPVRYGGDEFVILLPETGKQAGIEVTVRLQKTLARHQFLQSRGLALHMTGSFGLASFPDDARNAEDLLKAADAAMYLVKSGTRNGVAAAGLGLIPR